MEPRVLRVFTVLTLMVFTATAYGVTKIAPGQKLRYSTRSRFE